MVLSGDNQPTTGSSAAVENVQSGQASGRIPDLVIEPKQNSKPDQGSKSAEEERASQSELPSGRRGQVPDVVPKLRRSARYGVNSKIIDSGEHGSNHAASTPSSSPVLVESVRRNPKRKATPEIFEVSGDFLEASLEPWKENERDDWPSWTEVESDPVLFTRILRLFGVKQAKLQEVYSTDEVTLASLPAPVYGLIFLFEYEDDDDDSESAPQVKLPRPPQDMWFARQTTANACATVAILNIIMNAEGLALGEGLERFQHECRFLSPPLRGYYLSQSTWIRAAANSFSRRLDLLDAALMLQNQVDESKKQKTKKAKTVAKKKKKPSSAESAYHFIAYIPSQQKVWQLDGFEKKPKYVGEYQEGEHWTSVVSSVLAARMLEGEDRGAMFNLLALTGDPSGNMEAEADATSGRNKDHTPWIHEWVKKLADHGALKELHDTVKAANKS